MRRIGVWAVAVLTVASACNDAKSPSKAVHLDSGEHAVALNAQPTDTVLHFEIASGTCGGEERPTLRPVNVRETARSVTVTARVHHPPAPKLGKNHFCAGVGLSFPFDVTLQAPLGRRKLLDGTCRPPDDMLRRYDDTIYNPPDSRAACTPTAEERAAAHAVGTWTSFPAGTLSPRGEAYSFWTGREMLILGGLDIAGRRPLSDGAAYNPQTQQWRRIAAVPDPGRVRGAAWTGDGLFVLRQDGLDEGLYEVTHAYMYDAHTDKWRTIAAPPHAFRNPHAFWSGDTGVVWDELGGAVYRPETDTWDDIPKLDIRGASIGATAHWIPGTNELGVGGAFDPMNGEPGRAALLLYNPKTRTWRKAPDLPVTLRAFTFTPSFSLNDLVVYDSADIENITFTYTPRTDTWKRVPNWRDATTRDSGPGTTAAVELADGRIVLRVYDAHRPLYIFAKGAWQHAKNPPDPIPDTDGVVVTDGHDVFVWGQSRYDRPSAGWRWTPPPR